MIPNGPSSMRTVGRCVAQRPAVPPDTSTAKGRARMSACICDRSSTRNWSGWYMAITVGCGSVAARRGSVQPGGMTQRLIVDRLVGQGPEVAHDRQEGRVPEPLRQENADHVLLRVRVG